MHCNDFVILLSLINHWHDPNRLGSQEGHGNYWLLAQSMQISTKNAGSRFNSSSVRSFNLMRYGTTCVLLEASAELMADYLTT